MTRKKSDDRKRISITFDIPEKIVEEILLERPLDGVEIPIVRVPPRRLVATDFVAVTGDANHDRGLHVARKTDAPRRARVVPSTFCTEESGKPGRVGQRLDAVPVAAITCSNCLAKLGQLGINVKGV